MVYRFNEFALDTGRFELCKNGIAQPIEPQVTELLILLIENRERMISKQEINEIVWRGRIVSEAALSSRIKSAHQVLGDNGRLQQFIRTIHKKGFRFVAELEIEEYQQELEKAKAALMRELPEFSCAFAREELFYLKGRNRLICIFRGCN